VDASAASGPPVAELLGTASSGDNNIDSLVYSGDYKWGATGMMGASATVTYSFMESVPSYYSSGEVTDFSAFTDTMKAAARTALAAWANAATISFVEVDDTGDGGQIRFGANYQAASSGYAYYPDNDTGGDIWIANNFSSTVDPEIGGFGYLTYLHEIGHAIGLKHPGNYNAGGGGTEGPYLSSSLDNTDNTVMSYNDGTVIYPSSLGALDIQAAQYLYGISGSGTLGNVTWGSDAAETFAGDSGVNYVIARDGADYLDMGTGNDGVLAGSGADTILGGSGNDLIYGNVGTDLISGGSEADTLYGGQNAGELSLGDSTTLAYRDGADTLSGGAGTDLIYGNHGGDLMIGGDGADTLYGGQDQDTLSGGGGADVIFGNRGNDLMSGGASNDIFYGGAGNDTMVGGDGADVFVLTSDGGSDQIADFARLVDWLYVQSDINGSGITTGAGVIAAASQSGADTLIDLGGGNSVTLIGFNVSDLTTQDIFLF